MSSKEYRNYIINLIGNLANYTYPIRVFKLVKDMTGIDFCIEEFKYEEKI